MNIPVNKDFKNNYKDDLWRGFSAKEVLFVVLGLITWAGVAALVNLLTPLKLNACVLIGFPVAVPVIAFGFLRPQGRLSIVEYIREIIYTNKTRTAVFSSLENPEENEGRLFAMDLPSASRNNRKKKGESKK